MAEVVSATGVKMRKWEGPPKKVREKQAYVPTDASKKAEDEMREMLRKPGWSNDIKATLDFQIDEVRRVPSRRASSRRSERRASHHRRPNVRDTSDTSPSCRDRSKSLRPRRRRSAGPASPTPTVSSASCGRRPSPDRRARARAVRAVRTAAAGRKAKKRV